MTRLFLYVYWCKLTHLLNFLFLFKNTKIMIIFKEKKNNNEILTIDTKIYNNYNFSSVIFILYKILILTYLFNIYKKLWINSNFFNILNTILKLKILWGKKLN